MKISKSYTFKSIAKNRNNRTAIEEPVATDELLATPPPLTSMNEYLDDEDDYSTHLNSTDYLNHTEEDTENQSVNFETVKGWGWEGAKILFYIFMGFRVLRFFYKLF